MHEHDVILSQMEIADTYLRLLRERGLECAVAGGAPRNWRFGVPANDIDIFITSGVEQEVLEDIVGSPLEYLGDESYEGCEFCAYTLRHGGQEVQLITKSAESVEDIVEEFPVSISKAIYYGDGEFYFHNHFLMSARYGHLLIAPRGGHLGHKSIDYWKILSGLDDADFYIFCAVWRFIRYGVSQMRSETIWDDRTQRLREALIG